MPEWIGSYLGKVHVERLIARGGMAEVYLGTHISLARQVAVKVLLSHLEGEPDLQERFQREARVLAGLRHPNIVQIYDYDVANGQPYIVMEYVAGPSLGSYLRDLHRVGGRLTLPQIGRVLIMLASAIDYAHSLGVIHRDIKPANVLMHPRNNSSESASPVIENIEPILTDFGLLRLVDSAAKSTTGTVAGTPAYMSPEQARGEHVDGRSDLYSLGVMVYEMLAGRVPFEADTSMGIILKHLHEPPPPIPDLPESLRNVLDHILAKDPNERYNSAREFAAEFLEACRLTVEDVAPGYSLTPRPSMPPSRETRPTLPRFEEKSKKRTIPSFWIFTIPAAALIALGTFLIVRPQGTGISGSTTPTSAATQAPMDIPSTQPLSTTADTVFGLVRFHDVANQLDEATVTTRNLPPAQSGSQYEAWLVTDEERRSMGVLEVNAAGEGQLSFLDNQGRNLIGRYDRFEITLEADPDLSPSPSGQVVFSSGLPPEALGHIKHLLVSFGSTPNNVPLVYGLLNAAELVNTEAQTMLAASSAQDAVAIKKSAEGIYNLLVGNQGAEYGDLDGDGAAYDPGDGYGLLLNGDSSGFIEGSFSHAQYSAQMPDATGNIQLHAVHVMDSARNMEGWAVELRDLTRLILTDPTSSDANQRIRSAAALADRLLNGRDLNGNERIEPIAGEGGAQTVLEHAQYLADMPILSGPKRLPPAASPISDMPDIHNSTGGTPVATPEYSDPSYSP